MAKSEIENTQDSNAIGVMCSALVRRLSAWAWRDQMQLQQNVNEDAQALVDALKRGERADAYCGYGRDGQATNYRDELWFSLRALKPNDQGLATAGAGLSKP
jgi:hypothetical protein